MHLGRIPKHQEPPASLFPLHWELQNPQERLDKDRAGGSNERTAQALPPLAVFLESEKRLVRSFLLNFSSRADGFELNAATSRLFTTLASAFRCLESGRTQRAG